ncbi:MAG: NAD(P)-dependent oxidoreductase [Rhodospirillaceae bacterium]|nr:6-phosphogluconate dehydrogenase [Rhodospirillaceae bacterium]RPG02450.1 MAG: NAD(P)-dependent oxidoreductase [Rhodospirillaceae bacterium TMED63]RZO36004.1 MAG: NAD(P)-dependent oxidoreductase [Rhodospirillaceae bacterium]
MSVQDLSQHKIGWIGAGRMGFAMAQRLLEGGANVAVWNRTKSKAEPLAANGATVVDSPADLADRDIVFTMVGGPADFVQVTLGDGGVLVQEQKPKMLIDSTSVDEAASSEVREAAEQVGVPMLAAPVSGNAKVVKAGKLTFAVSGPEAAYNEARPYLDVIGRGSSYVGEGELSRFIKICHNLMLGVVIQNMVEITVLAEKAGVPRHAFLDFLNNSVMGSMFTKYKSPSLVNLDYSVTFTPKLLLKDLDLGLAAARANGVPMPVTTAAREVVQMLIGNGYTEEDFAALLSMQAKVSGLDLKSEDEKVSDGLSD